MRNSRVRPTKDIEDIIDGIIPASDHRLELYQRISKQNRARSGAMERRIAKQLRGMRVPLSGAGVMKGDVFIRLPNDMSYLIECKSSAALSMNGTPRLTLKTSWFTRLDQNIESMRTWNVMFGALVIHYHTHTHDFVFVDASRLSHLPELLKAVEGVEVQTLVSKAVKFPYNALLEGTRDGKGLLYKLTAIDKTVLVIDFELFKEVANGHYFGLVEDSAKEMDGGEGLTV